MPTPMSGYRMWALVIVQFTSKQHYFSVKINLVDLTTFNAIQSKLILPQSCLVRSIDVEHFFSCGQLLLSHVQSQLSAHTKAAILCLKPWSHVDLIKNEDILKVTSLPDVISDGDIIILD